MCRGHGVRSRAEAMCRELADCLGWSAFTNKWSCNSANSLSQRSCQFVVRLKVNKYYPELLSSLSFYLNLLNLLNLKDSAFNSWSLAVFRLLAPDPDLKPLAVLVLVFSFGQLLLGKVCHNLTALEWVAWHLLLNWLFSTLIVCDFSLLCNHSQLFSVSPSSGLSGIPINYVQLCVIHFDCS